MLLIPELEDLKAVENFDDVVRLRNFVCSTVPCSLSPSTELNMGIDNINALYKLFKEKKEGGWCGLNADYFWALLRWYKVKARPFNYGLQKHRFTHIGLVVEIDGEEFFMDPYFAMNYAHVDGYRLTFDQLMKLVMGRNLDQIVPAFSDVQKPVQQPDGSFTLKMRQEHHEVIMNRWYHRGYENVMSDIFGDKNPLLLMLIKILG